MKDFKRNQDLVTVKIPREVRDVLKELAARESRSMVKQIEYMVSKEKRLGQF